MMSLWSGPSWPAMVSRVSEVRRLIFLVSVFLVCVSICSSQNTPPTDPTEIDALKAFRNTLTNSREQLPNWFSGGDPCNLWTGVICLQSDYPNSLSNSNFSHVTELRLLRRSLTGTLAPELGNLKALRVLDVMWNEMTGTIPDTFGSLTSLFLLLLNGNVFSGNLPDSLGNLANLNRIQIDENEISGPVPRSFQNLTAIEHLHMNNNSISGAIPSELGKLPNLVHLLLDNNNLTGTLPPELSNMTTLMILQLDNNHFDDGTTIPKEYAQIPSLLKLSLRNCNIIGQIPDLSLSTKLGVLDLSENKLNGSIPSFPPEMTAIDLSDNELTGAVPDKLGSLGNLSYLLLGNNNLRGSIPTSLGSAPIYSDSNSRFIWDFQNNNITSWPNSTTLLQLPTGRASFWFAGNPICDGQFAVNCQPNNVNSELQVGGVINSSSNLGTTCVNTCGGNSRLVPDAQNNGCKCAVPIIIWYRLKSPGFNVFDLYERGFLVYISSALTVSMDQVDILDYTYEPGPRLSMHLHLFPASGVYFNDSETQRITNAFSDWNLADDPIFGPYELLRITVNPPPGGSKGLSPGAIVGIVLGLLLALAVIGLIAALIVLRKRRKSQLAARKQRFGAYRMNSRIRATGLQEWLWEEMEEFTNKFSDTNVLGVGGFGKVYMGVLPDGSKVAIKRAGMAAGSSEQFETEIELLSRVHHRNLVALKGFCHDDVSGDQFLVYEFVENGTVENHLPPNSTTPLDFPTRLRVALGAARGINYLHTEAYPPIYHRDIKASNILLDKKFHAKVADFGVSRNAPEPDEDGGVGGGVDTLVKGTPGYLDPEYCLTHTLTDKSDVYSFGVFLMVLLTGRQAITQGKNIVRHVKMARDANMLWSLVDTYMADRCPTEIAEAWAKLALRCCAEDPIDRPSMTEVVNELDILYKDCSAFRSETDSTPSTTTTTTTSEDRTRSFPSSATTLSQQDSGVDLMSSYDGKRSDE